jgi:hypothetical protein
MDAAPVIPKTVEMALMADCAGSGSPYRGRVLEFEIPTTQQESPMTKKIETRKIQAGDKVVRDEATQNVGKIRLGDGAPVFVRLGDGAPVFGR